MTIWDCKIGTRDILSLPDGADFPMRQAIEKVYREITGQDCDFIFSGWGAKLTDGEREIVERGEKTLNQVIVAHERAAIREEAV